MAARGGISGIAVTIGAAGLYLVYAGIRDVPVVEGLRELARGRVPAGKPPQTTQTVSSRDAGGTYTTAGGRVLMPVAGARVGDGFGAARPAGRKHKGVDLIIGTGTPIRAALAGVVYRRGWDAGAGNYVDLKHPGATPDMTKYFHMSDFAVSYGQEVSQGQVIGYVGSTGSSSGPHLHFETWVGGSAVDPMRFLGGGTVSV